MLISDDYRFLFIHVPKTAGSSVTRVLRPYARRGSDFWLTRWLLRAGVRSNLLAPPRYRTYRRHITAGKLQWYLPRQEFQQYFKFAFVRNPWDWLVSYYHFVLERPQHRRYRQLQRLGGFDGFLAYECRRRRFLQHRFLTDRQGRLLVDFVGKFENLEEDFAQVCREVHLDVRLVRSNSSAHRDYRGYYSDQMIERVAEAYADDIQRFGYRFDGDFRRAA